MPRAVLLNGPPGSGKDTLAGRLVGSSNLPMKIVKFAAPIKRIVAATYFGGDYEAFQRFDTFEMKNIPHDRFFGKSCRQVQISTSEDWLKILHGQNVFGDILANDIQESPGAYECFHIVSDSGFRAEAEVLINRFNPENVLLVRIHREGFTYAGDSRNYIYLDDLGVRSLDIKNEENKAADAVNAINDFIKESWSV